MFRGVLVAATVLLALLTATSRASSTSISPCRQVSLRPGRRTARRSRSTAGAGLRRAAIATRTTCPGALHRKRRRHGRPAGPLHGVHRQVPRPALPDRLVAAECAPLPARCRSGCDGRSAEASACRSTRSPCRPATRSGGSPAGTVMLVKTRQARRREERQKNRCSHENATCPQGTACLMAH